MAEPEPIQPSPAAARAARFGQTHLVTPQTTNTKLAAALAALGIPLRKQDPFRVMIGDVGERVAYFFEPVDPSGRFVTAELILAWDDQEWHQRNPEHPFAYMKVAFSNHERLLDWIRKKIPIVAVTRGSKIAFLTRDAHPVVERNVFERLKRRRRYAD